MNQIHIMLDTQDQRRKDFCYNTFKQVMKKAGKENFNDAQVVETVLDNLDLTREEAAWMCFKLGCIKNDPMRMLMNMMEDNSEQPGI